MNIGKAAERSGVTAKMIRHYEMCGLIAPKRLKNGYRAYGERIIQELTFIRHARALAFSLQEIRELLNLWRDTARSPKATHDLALGQVKALEKQAHALTAITEPLRQLIASCDADGAAGAGRDGRARSVMVNHGICSGRP